MLELKQIKHFLAILLWFSTSIENVVTAAKCFYYPYYDTQGSNPLYRFNIECEDICCSIQYPLTDSEACCVRPKSNWANTGPLFWVTISILILVAIIVIVCIWKFGWLYWLQRKNKANSAAKSEARQQNTSPVMVAPAFSRESTQNQDGLYDQHGVFILNEQKSFIYPNNPVLVKNRSTLNSAVSRNSMPNITD